MTKPCKRKVIIITDGDKVAKRTVEIAAKNVGARCISLSAGNPTEISGERAVNLIKRAAYDPVILMVDDRGHMGCGKGETVLNYVVNHPEIDVLGVVAVASNTPCTHGIKVEESVTRDGQIIRGPVNKMGDPEPKKHKYLEGDTVDILDSINAGIVIGMGDVGKMEMADDVSKGAPITTKALQEILERSGYAYAGDDGPKNPG